MTITLYYSIKKLVEGNVHGKNELKLDARDVSNGKARGGGKRREEGTGW